MAAQPSAKGRIDSIDLLRGIVMVIMMLDHTRDFVHRDMLQGLDPTDLAHTSLPLFFTRWITHYCAPVFVFLAGTGSYLQFSRGKSKRELSQFLITRGLWLIVLEFTIIRFGVFFDVSYSFLGFMQVIWVLGVSMIVLAGLIHLPLRVVGIFGVAMILLHNLTDGFRVTGWKGPESPVLGMGAKLWILLHQAFEPLPVLWFFPSPVVFVVYPLIPWIGVMAAGYVFGAVYQWDFARRRRFLLALGGAATALFVILRLVDIYGDSARWSRQSTAAFTVLSFLNTTKYPPSLLFLLMTLGPSLLLLAWFESSSSRQATESASPTFFERVRSVFVTFGRVPLFFYILQWYTAHFISVAVHLIGGRSVGWMFSGQAGMGSAPPDAGFSLPVVYLCWIIGVVLLYPLCKWFAGVKARRRDWWLSYL